MDAFVSNVFDLFVFQITDLATIDVIKEVSSLNANMLIVHRIEILGKSFDENKNMIILIVRQNKNLTIENYDQE